MLTNSLPSETPHKESIVSIPRSVFNIGISRNLSRGLPLKLTCSKQMYVVADSTRLSSCHLMIRDAIVDFGWQIVTTDPDLVATLLKKRTIEEHDLDNFVLEPFFGHRR
jgi:hypothetical protein